MDGLRRNFKWWCCEQAGWPRGMFCWKTNTVAVTDKWCLMLIDLFFLDCHMILEMLYNICILCGTDLILPQQEATQQLPKKDTKDYDSPEFWQIKHRNYVQWIWRWHVLPLSLSGFSTYSNLLVSQGAPPVEVSWPFQMSWQKLSSVPQNASIPRQDMRIWHCRFVSCSIFLIYLDLHLWKQCQRWCLYR